jgi:hypothetical protein
MPTRGSESWEEEKEEGEENLGRRLQSTEQKTPIYTPYQRATL